MTLVCEQKQASYARGGDVVTAPPGVADIVQVWPLTQSSSNWFTTDHYLNMLDDTVFLACLPSSASMHEGRKLKPRSFISLLKDEGRSRIL